MTASKRHNGPYFGFFTFFVIPVTLVASQPIHRGHVFLGTTVRASAMPAFVLRMFYSHGIRLGPTMSFRLCVCRHTALYKIVYCRRIEYENPNMKQTSSAHDSDATKQSIFTWGTKLLVSSPVFFEHRQSGAR